MNRGDLYDAIHDEAAFAHLPTMVAQLSGGRSTTLYRFDDNWQLNDLRYCYFSDDVIARILSDPQRLDTWGNAGFATGIVGRALALDSVLPQEQYRRSPLFNEIVRPMGDDTGHCMGIVHRLDGATLCTAIQRPFGDGAFTKAETARLESLIVDLQRIYLSRALIGDQARKIDSLNTLLDEGDEGLLLVGPKLHVIEATHHARTLIANSGLARINGGTLRFTDVKLEQRVKKAVEDTFNRRATAQVTFTWDDPKRGAIVNLLVLPLAPGERTGCMIRVRQEDSLIRHADLWLTRHYGLTSAEVRVAEALAAGHSPEEISVQRSVSLNTVRSQVRQILQKTGCDTVTRLVVLIRTLP